jgi:prepilin-type processing-associated H-X9-DG protein
MGLSSSEAVFNEDSVDVDFRVESNGNANMLFVDGGNDKIGIGLNSPNTSLHIRSSTASNIAGYRDGTTGLIVEGDAASYIQLVASKTNPMGLLFDGGDTHNDTSRGGMLYDIDYGLAFKSGGATRWKIDEAGDIIPYSTSSGIVLGSTTNVDSNTLDDYEEGTWTPSMGGDTTYSARTGVYTKVGNKVFIRGQVSINQIGSGSTSIITGLPFTSESTTNGNPAGVLGVSYYANLAIAVTYISGYVESAQSRIQISANATAHATVQYNTGNFFGNSTRLDFSMTYRV